MRSCLRRPVGRVADYVFFKATTAMTFEFDTDAAGNVTGLTLVQSGARRRAAKTK
jgi:hypothetical protein